MPYKQVKEFNKEHEGPSTSDSMLMGPKKSASFPKKRLKDSDTSKMAQLGDGNDIKNCESTVNVSPQNVIDIFNNGGLLARTVQEKHARSEFENCNDSISSAMTRQTQGGHGGLRKFSLIQNELFPSLYKMGDDVGAFGRFMGVLAIPDKVGEHVVAIHSKDNSSGNITSDMNYMSHSEASNGISNLLTELKSNQKERPNEALENNEIQLVGINPESLVGFIYYPTKGFGIPKDWHQARGKFEKLIDSSKDNIPFNEMHVFTYNHNDNKTDLVHLDTLNVNR